MEIKDDHKTIIKNIYMGILVDIMIFDDGTIETNNYFAAFERLKGEIGIVGKNPYYYYKDIYGNDYYYINDKGIVISCNNELPEVLKCKSKIVNFFSVEEIIIRSKKLLEAVSEINNFSQDYYNDFLKIETFIEKHINNSEINEFVFERLIEYLETIYYIALDETEESLIKNFTNQLASICREKFMVIHGDLKKEYKYNSENKKNLVLIKKDKLGKLT